MKYPNLHVWFRGRHLDWRLSNQLGSLRPIQEFDSQLQIMTPLTQTLEASRVWLREQESQNSQLPALAWPVWNLWEFGSEPRNGRSLVVSLIYISQ